ncbi:MAG: signal peptidase I [Treponema sp.]|nr:signal peptidase I [Treponema sp.]
MNNKKEFSKEFIKLRAFTLFEFGAAIIFTILELSFHADISLLAFPLAAAYLALTFWFLIKKIFFETDGKRLLLAIKLNEYLPYFLFITFILRRAGNDGTSFVVDVFAVISWFIIFVFAYLNSRKLYFPKNKVLFKNWSVVPVEKVYKGNTKIFAEIVEWVDAFFWSIFTALIFQIFVIQLYGIPSESMVPTFLVKDKVFVSKIDCGPKFPLTDVGLPDFRHYKRGDTIVLRNPHYTIDRKSEVKTVVSNLVYMFSLTTVQLNKDADGKQISDPLVKRIAGLPGEQLVMQDGTLYRRTINSDVFEPVELDSKYATWNLNALSKKIKPYIQEFPLSASGYQVLLDFEEQRRNFDLAIAEYQAYEMAREFSRLAVLNKDAGTFSCPYYDEGFFYGNRKQLAKDLYMKEGGTEWFVKFMTSWIPSKNDVRDIYSEANFKLNVMAKIYFGKTVLEYAKLLKQNVPENKWDEGEEIKALLNDFMIHYYYVQELLDLRNMPVFPSDDKEGNPQYIPQDCYFMMGDNRFNSLDLRHSYERTEKSLASSDPLSLTYQSLMAPQYIHKKYVIGKPLFRILPLRRFGKV